MQLRGFCGLIILLVESVSLNLLYVDDDHNDLALFGLAVDRTDYDIRLFTLSDGQAAIDYLQGAPNYADRELHPVPDLILLDLKMVKTSGFEFLAWRKNSLFAYIPVILFSSDARPVYKQRGLGLGADAYIEKPNAFAELKRAVGEIWTWWENYRRKLRPSAL